MPLGWASMWPVLDVLLANMQALHITAQHTHCMHYSDRGSEMGKADIEGSNCQQAVHNYASQQPSPEASPNYPPPRPDQANPAPSTEDHPTLEEHNLS